MKKAVVIILAVMIILSVIGISAYAADDIASGTFGSCSWAIDGDGLLTISPTTGTEGTLNAGSYPVNWPWYNYRTQVTGVKFTGTVHSGTATGGMFYGMTNLKAADMTGFDTSASKSMLMMFQGCVSLETLDLSGFNTSNVTDFSQMFAGDYDNRMDIESITFGENFKTSSATTMRMMFQYCRKLTTLDVAGWDMSSVTDTEYMFYRCERLKNLDVSNWNTSKITSMKCMFAECTMLESLGENNVKNWDTSSVTNMHQLFYGCNSLKKLDVSRWETNKVEDMSYLFDSCFVVDELDVSNWNTSKVKFLSYMFRNCRAVTELNVSGFDTSKVEGMRYMFFGCRELVSLDLSSWTTASIPITASGDYGLDQMFASTPHLKEIKLGVNFDPDTSPRAAVFDAHTLKTNGTGWTGKWVNKDTGKSYTPAEIKALPGTDLAGTWLWEGQITFTSVDASNSNAVMPNMDFKVGDASFTTDANGKLVVTGVYESDVAFTITKTTIDDYTNKGPWTVTVSTEYVPYDQNSSNGWKLSAITLDANNQNANNTLVNEKPVTSYTVSYASGGGNGNMDDDTVNIGDPYSFPECGFTRSGYVFDHWQVTGDETAYKPGDLYTLSGDITVTAVWKWAGGKLKLEFGWIEPDDYRNGMQSPKGYSIQWSTIPYWSTGAASLLDSDGNVVGSYTGESRHTFEGLSAGTYTIRLDILDRGYYSIFKSIPSITNLLTAYETEVEIMEGSTSEIVWRVVVEYKAYDFKTVTEIGTFENGTSADLKEKDYFPDMSEEETRNWSYPNEDTSSNVTHKTFGTHSGIYYGDHALQYSKVPYLEEPVLSDEEKAAGYKFIGWKVQGTETIISELQAMRLIVKEDIVLEAVFDIPSYYTVIWVNGNEQLEQDAEVLKGSQPSYDGNIPTKTMDGEEYSFIGWSRDKDALYGLSAADLPRVTEDVTYYAIFQKPAADGKTIVKVEKTKTEGNVDTYTIYYSDGTTYEFTITNGQDGQDGQDGNNGSNGSNGKDGVGIDRIEKTGTEGNVDIYTIYYTDGTTFVFTISNAADAQNSSVPDDLNGEDHFAYIIGYPDGKVHPEGNITRAEVATIFFRLLKDEVRDANLSRTNSFSDVDSGAWYNTAISTMAAMGIVKGYEDGTFRPNANITRAEFAAIAARFDTTAAQPVYFTDTYGHWATAEISRAARNGWINGYPDGSFKPNQAITRAEAMALVNRVLNRDPAEPEDLLDDMIQWPDNMDTAKWYYLDVQEATNGHDYERDTNPTEKWTELQEPRDWAALEK